VSGDTVPVGTSKDDLSQVKSWYRPSPIIRFLPARRRFASKFRCGICPNGKPVRLRTASQTDGKPVAVKNPASLPANDELLYPRGKLLEK